ncbi:unnamed protein product [Spirodela intermedia]|uniref:RING-type E3 ubiquitin transferase n=1 Tax=Spirodela intermedia TaxID=51605 RepID=A0A7I8J2B5_SPIIN|nr:unnamed protein product [Spirodela intermedia]CAA6664364.1 unnamed protein product [Spirodela intermedia]
MSSFATSLDDAARRRCYGGATAPGSCSSRGRRRPPAGPLGGDRWEEPYHVWYIKTVGLDEMTIEAISVFPYKKGEGLVDGSDCAVCLGEFQEGEMLRLLPKCSHAFHIPCIDTWLRSHVNCPLCRAPIVAPPKTLHLRSSTRHWQQKLNGGGGSGRFGSRRTG